MTELSRSEMDLLLAQSEFRRFLWTVIQSAGILAASTDGAEGRHLAYDEGRRNLGLDILADVARAQPVDDAEIAFNLTLFQILREQAQQAQEKPRGRRSRYDRTRDLDADRDDDGADGGGE